MEQVLKSTCHPLAGKKIIVAGAGIAGLAFVISLRKFWHQGMGRFPHIIQYERDQQQPGFNRSGYSIGLHSDRSSPTLQTLREMNVLDSVMNSGVTRKQNQRGYLGLWSLGWRPLVNIRQRDVDALPTSSIRISRSALRSILLLAALGHTKIEWGNTCTKILASYGGKIRLQLNNQTEEECDFLVAADGANSKLRSSIRPNDGLSFTGIVSISAIASFEESPPEPVSHDWGIVPSGQGVALFASPFDRQCAFWSLSYKSRVPRAALQQPLPVEVSSGLLREAMMRGECFREPFQTLVARSDPATLMVLNTMDKPPFSHRSADGVPTGVSFIGDSNHAISQFAGAGANMAILDGYDLAKCLCNHERLDEALSAYDKRSLGRASASIRKARTCIKMVHASGLSWLSYYSTLLLFGRIIQMWHAVLRRIGISKRQT